MSKPNNLKSSTTTLPQPAWVTALYGRYDHNVLSPTPAPSTSSNSTRSTNSIGLAKSTPIGYTESVDKADFQRYKEARWPEVAAGISRGELSRPPSKFHNEERRIPSISRSQESTTLEAGSSSALESAAKSYSNPSRETSVQYEHSILRRSMRAQESQVLQTRYELPAGLLTPDTRETQRNLVDERMKSFRKTLATLAQRRGDSFAELEGTPIGQLPPQGGADRPLVRTLKTPQPPPGPQKLDQKSISTKQPPQVLPKESIGSGKDPYFFARAEFHLQQWLNESDKGDLPAATEHLTVVENMIIEKWGSIKAAPKGHIRSFLTCKIMNLIRYNQDQEALELAKYIESVHQDKARGKVSGTHFIALIVLYMRLKDWDTAKMKCTQFLQLEYLESLDPKIHFADQSLGFWLMAKILKGSGKSVEAKFYKAQVKPGLSSHSWYKWAEQCLRQR
ncbi:hypothetical protein TWF506_004407 [Arthrobotrys conoides]|uniref:Uncharacterized protein n=1 Tax=Arthrobotrys conoides TaxID=74498 RepID=A0AAN8N0M9_9PEZI